MIKYLKRVAFASVGAPAAIVCATLGALATWVAVVICKENELGEFFERMKNKK